MIYAEITQLEDRYQVDILPEDLFLEAAKFSDIPIELESLGYRTKDEIQINQDTWHLILEDKEHKQRTINGYGLVISYHKVYDVVAVLDSGRSKDGRRDLPIPGSELAKSSKQYNDVIVYQDREYHAIWSANKQTLDQIRKRVIEWRRNHRFRIERFL